MSIRRITISVPGDVADRIKEAAGSIPVSAWVTRLIEDRLDDEQLDRQWESFYRSVHPDPAEVRRANKIFRKLTGRGLRKRVA